jgi:hypothetical protein
MRALAVVCLLAAHAAADTRASSTALTLTRGKAKPIRVLAKKIEVNVVRPLTPCVLQVVVEPQHPMFKRFTFEITYQVSSSGAIKSSRGPINAEIVAIGAADPINTRRGQVEVTARKSHAFDAKLSAMFDHSNSQWTLSGVVKVENAACMWDLE